MTSNQHSSNDDLWREMYFVLQPSVRKYVCNAGVQSWLGQEYDITDDIVQDTIVRAYVYMRQSEEGIVDPIVSLKHFSERIAHNRGEDQRKRETRLVRPALYEYNTAVEESAETHGCWTDPIEEALEELALLSLFVEVAYLIKVLPTKRRTALLVDLAHLSDFGEQPSLLEAALLEVGIRLKDYQRALPFDHKHRSQHAALLSLAYKRLRTTALPRLSALFLIY